MKMSDLTSITPADPSRLNDPKHWRDKAQEARIKGEGMRDPIARKTMQGVAHDYERLAARAEERRTHQN
jgi:hypothetical protein